MSQNLIVSQYKCTDNIISDVGYKCRNITYAAIACNPLKYIVEYKFLHYNSV